MNKITPKKIIGAIGILALIAILSATLFLVKQTQEIRKKAGLNEFNLNIEPKNVTKIAGESFTTTLYLENNTDGAKEFRVAGLEIEFDPNVFNIKSISCNSSSFPLTIVNRYEDNRILLTCSGQGGENPQVLAKDNMLILGTVDLEIKNTAPAGITNLTLKRFNIPNAATSFNEAAIINENNPPVFSYTIENDLQENPTQKYSIHLKQGANLISVPFSISNSPTEVLSEIENQYSKLFTFNGQTKQWQNYNVSLPVWTNSLENIDHSMGFWLYANSDLTLNLSGNYPEETNIPLYQGANLIGFPSNQPKSIQDALSSIEGKYTKLFEYDSQSKSWKSYDNSLPDWANHLTELKPGFGYWIYVSEDCSLKIENK